MAVTIKRGDVFYADLSPVVGSEQGGMRPVLIIQNDIGNHYSPTVVVAAITTKIPTHVGLTAQADGIARDSVILLEQIRTIDKRRLRQRLTHLNAQKMSAVNHALLISLGLLPMNSKKADA